MSVTIKDVAKHANVSPSTVSRVISDSEKISEPTKRKVRKVMEELGYHINLNARGLVQKSTQTIGIVMKHATSKALYNPFFPELLSGISSECHNQDYSILLTTADSEESIYEEVVKMVQGKRVDGIIVSYSKKDDKVVPYLLENGIPFVVIGKPVKYANRIMHVDNDNVRASMEATEYLIRLGHERISFLGDDPGYQVVLDRLEGYQTTMRKYDLDIPKNYIQMIPFNMDKVQKVIGKLLDMPEPPTAMVASTDVNALVIMSALGNKKVKVPRDMSIISFNNTIISQLSTPPMTSVDVQTFQLGYEAAKSVIELIKNPDMFKKSIIIPTNIIKRESTLAYQTEKI
ncbi:LacI family DNA-binding transcriptional regulator [Oceanobacillus halophilus]|uniref:LacI family transcriptional regulator n=1 Tax=Oceanobacillus halophilus TaxID=930130 RepID=A0A495A7L8_9BACI|nr:LacI family DNA-binding transcriptional regulator [Oceanobacillus halophilus]RKQ35614.1 LacI family transcriptional regulator [Oceanobacillus halophilus]